MNIAIASDHAGFRYKTLIAAHLSESGHRVVDFGTSSTEPVDYPDFVRLAAMAVASGQCERGVVLGGSGNGEAIAANRHRGVRCAVCWNDESARLARLHNDANMISLGERMLSESAAIRMVDTWIATTFEGGRHVPRLRKLDANSIVHVALVVRDYDEAIAFFRDKLRFTVVEDSYQPAQNKRWVVVAPPGGQGTSLLLARATTEEQVASIGNQTGGRVFLFLSTDDFWRDYNHMRSVGIEFVREPKTEAYGTVAVFRDVSGNLWDLLELTRGA